MLPHDPEGREMGGKQGTLDQSSDGARRGASLTWGRPLGPIPELRLRTGRASPARPGSQGAELTAHPLGEELPQPGPCPCPLLSAGKTARCRGGEPSNR